MSDKLPQSMNAETEDGPVTGYMCLIDWECELGAACDGTCVYPSEADLRACRSCVEECGIVEVEVRIRRVVHPGTLG